MWKILRFVTAQVPNGGLCQIRIFRTNYSTKTSDENEDDGDSFGTLSHENLLKLKPEGISGNNISIGLQLNEHVKNDTYIKKTVKNEKYVKQEEKADSSNIKEINYSKSANHKKVMDSSKVKETYDLNSRLKKISKTSYGTNFEQVTTDVRDSTEFANVSYLKDKIHRKTKDEKKSKKFDNESTGFRTVSYEQFPPQFFLERIEKHLARKDLKTALEIVEDEMPTRLVLPDQSIYTAIIDGCSKVGYIDKAFSLYVKMRQQNISASHTIYASLFKACSICPDSFTDGLKKATTLRQNLIDADWQCNSYVYRHMIQAFGRCGNLQMAFEITDEMAVKGNILDTSVMNCLLEGCVTDKNTGFRYAITIWKRMRNLDIKPNMYSYNLLLKCIQECSSGEPLAPELKTDADAFPIKQLSSEDIAHQEKIINSCDSSQDIDLTESDQCLSLEGQQIPSLSRPSEEIGISNFLAGDIDEYKCFNNDSLNNSYDRLMLVGGPVGIFENMIRDKVKPNEKTITHFLLLSNSYDDEMFLLNLMNKLKLKPDMYICNLLMRKRIMRGEVKLAKDIIDYMAENNLKPDDFTCINLSKLCHKSSEVENFLDEVKYGLNLPITSKILNNLIRNAIKRKDFICVIDLIKKYKEHDVKPNINTIKILENARNHIRSNLVYNKEHSTQIPDDQRRFLTSYKKWLNILEMDQEEHPWKKYGHTPKSQEVVLKR